MYRRSLDIFYLYLNFINRFTIPHYLLNETIDNLEFEKKKLDFKRYI